MPTACPLCAQVAMTRVEPKATCEALMMRPARKRFLMLRLYMAAVGNLVDALGVPLGAAGERAVDAVGRMQIDRPAAEGNGVGVRALLDDVLLGEHVVAFEATALALAGDGADPFQRHGFGLGKLAGVLDVVPDAVDDLPQLPLDRLGLVDRVEAAAVLEPPEAAAGIGGLDVAIARDLA